MPKNKYKQYHELGPKQKKRRDNANSIVINALPPDNCVDDADECNCDPVMEKSPSDSGELRVPLDDFPDILLDDLVGLEISDPLNSTCDIENYYPDSDSDSESESFNDNYDGSGDDIFYDALSEQSEEITPNIKVFDFNMFKHQLTVWGSDKVYRSKANDILKLLKLHPDFQKLPNDFRTLLKTPRTTDTKPVGRGLYSHLGVKKNLVEILKKYEHVKQKKTLDMQCNIDDIPIAKSSGSSLRPILMSLSEFPEIPPFVAGIYHGNEKPSDLEEYLADHVKEMSELKVNGLEFGGNTYKVNICYVCDAPARANIAQIKGHTGYESCGKCLIHGQRTKNRVVFIEKNQSIPRSDASFRARENPEHHIGNSPIEKIPGTRMVTDFLYDYMHLVCLGVVRKILLLFMTGSCAAKLTKKNLNVLCERLESIRHFIPSDFPRKPRTMLELLRWKATEFRQFLLYTGPLMLKNVTSDDIYLHFLSLHYAIRILVSNRYLNADNLAYAKELLVYVVKMFPKLYGSWNVSYNVHGLLHLVEDVTNYGPLDLFSAFKFENLLQMLKKLVRKAAYPLQQIVRRLTEQKLLNIESKVVVTKKISNLVESKCFGTLPLNLQSPVYSSFVMNNSKISSKSPDNCVILKNNKIVVIKGIASHNNDVLIYGREFTDVSDFYTVPQSSMEIGIFSAKHLSGLQCWHVDEISSKAMMLVDVSNANRDSYYVAEVIHHAA